jgi:hypothetical protein|tara:strand:- start:58 stop:177 length:120 start_codon:yes stop_codon:yes gene_type:complete
MAAAVMTHLITRETAKVKIRRRRKRARGRKRREIKRSEN